MGGCVALRHSGHLIVLLPPHPEGAASSQHQASDVEIDGDLFTWPPPTGPAPTSRAPAPAQGAWPAGANRAGWLQCAPPSIRAPSRPLPARREGGSPQQADSTGQIPDGEAALAAFLEANQGPLIGAGMEGDAPANPPLEHIVENLDVGHGHNGGGPDPEAVPRKGWPGPFAIRSPRQPNPVAASLRSPCARAATWDGPAA